MTRFFGAVGYGENTEVRPGIYEDIITEKSYTGDVKRNVRLFHEGPSVNDDLSLSTSISIVADPYANENLHNIRYVQWNGARWKVSDVDASQRPRLLLRLGGVYNGPTPNPVTP